MWKHSYYKKSGHRNSQYSHPSFILVPKAVLHHPIHALCTPQSPRPVQWQLMCGTPACETNSVSVRVGASPFNTTTILNGTVHVLTSSMFKSRGVLWWKQTTNKYDKVTDIFARVYAINTNYSHPLTPLSSSIFTSAPFSIRNQIVSTLQLKAAQCRGVIWQGETLKDIKDWAHGFWNLNAKWTRLKLFTIVKHSSTFDVYCDIISSCAHQHVSPSSRVHECKMSYGIDMSWFSQLSPPIHSDLTCSLWEL